MGIALCRAADYLRIVFFILQIRPFVRVNIQCHALPERLSSDTSWSGSFSRSDLGRPIDLKAQDGRTPGHFLRRADGVFASSNILDLVPFAVCPSYATPRPDRSLVIIFMLHTLRPSKTATQTDLRGPTILRVLFPS